MAERETTFDVRVWKVSKVPSTKKSGKPGHAYRVRWSVAGRTRSATYPTAALAESERAALMTAARRGEAFDVATGRPVSMLVPEPVATYSWWEWALAYVDLKWPGLAPNSRLSLAEALTAITMALVPETPDRPPAADLRQAMMQWAFIVPRRTAGGPPADLDRPVTWLAANAPELSALSDPVVIRSVLDALAVKLDRTPAAATTVARKRAVLFNALELAVEQGKLDANPMPRVRWKAPKPATAVDPACVVNIEQARALLAAVAEIGPLVQAPPRPYAEGATLPPPRVPRGGPLVAFFGCLYYAGMRPSEALALVEDDLQLPDEDEWGLIRVSRNDPEVTTAWTDQGRREPRQLKHRAKGDVRVVPCSPELAALLRRHLGEYGVDRHGRLFRGARGGAVKESVYTDVWQHARAHVLTRAEAASSLAARPYDLRHSCVSTWLAAGVDPTLIADWVGHSLAVLHRVYAHVLPGRDEIAKQRIRAMFASE